MSSLLETLAGRMSPGVLSQIGRSLGTDQKTAGTASAAAITTLIAALSRNAASPEGASSLLSALDRNHDGSVLDDLGGFLGSGRTGDGDAILGHVLGGRRDRVTAGLAQSTGLDAAAAGKLLAMLAPVVMGALGKSQRQGGLDASSLSGFLGQERGSLVSKNPQAMGMLGSLLDADGDGDFDLSDAASRGMDLLGGLLGGSRR